MAQHSTALVGRLPPVVPVVARRDADRGDVAAPPAAAADQGLGQRRLRAAARSLRGRGAARLLPRLHARVVRAGDRHAEGALPRDRDHRLRRLGTSTPSGDPARPSARCAGPVPRGARIIICSLPPAKQVLLSQFMWEYAPAVGVATGGALSFFVGDVKRAPRWVSRLSFEWLWRLAARAGAAVARYLVEDVAALPVFAAWSSTGWPGDPSRTSTSVEITGLRTHASGPAGAAAAPAPHRPADLGTEPPGRPASWPPHGAVDGQPSGAEHPRPGSGCRSAAPDRRGRAPRGTGPTAGSARASVAAVWKWSLPQWGRPS